MGNKYFEFGSPTGPYYERLIQKGVDTPLHLRKQRIYYDSPFEKQHIIQRADPYPKYVFSASGASRISTRWGKYVSDAVNASTGSPVGQATIIAKLNDLWKQTDLNLGLVLSPEGRESASMVAESLVRISNAARSLRRGSFDGALSHLKRVPRADRREALTKFDQGDLSGSFLALHLGWSPLISDIYSASEVLTEKVKPEVKRLKASVGNVGAFINYAGSNPYAIFDGDAFGVQTIIAGTSRSPTFSERFGLNNPFLVAWNLVPLSFVADYFLPISDVISAAEFIGTNTLQRGWYKNYTEISYNINYPPGALRETYSGVVYSNRQPVTLSKKTVFAKREPYVPSLGQALDIKATMPESIMRLSTMAALTHQRILSLDKKR